MGTMEIGGKNMNRIGTITREGTFIEGSLKQDSWMDRWLVAHEINYDGELTDEICERIKKAFNDHVSNKWKYPGIAMLRTPQRPEVKHVDREKRVLVVEHSTMLCD
jgi:hypothetical protein